MLKRLRRRLSPYLGPLDAHLQSWKTLTVGGGIPVQYKRCLDGGGGDFGQDYVPFLTKAGMPRVRRAFEWCSGPAFIGFSLLGSGLCETLCLADINPLAVRAVKKTIARSGLADRVSVHLSDNLRDVPESERWDLVVGNPPHFAELRPEERNILAYDPDWKIHEAFYRDVGRHLAPGGVVLIQENNHGSEAETFRRQIEGSGLTLVHATPHEKPVSAGHRFFYVASIRKGDRPPDWLARLAGPGAGA